MADYKQARKYFVKRNSDFFVLYFKYLFEVNAYIILFNILELLSIYLYILPLILEFYFSLFTTHVPG